MATPQNTNNTKVGAGNDTAKKTYTTQKYGNDHGHLSFGHIHKDGSVRSDVLLQASDGRHHLSMDKDGERKGFTTIVAPRNFQVDCGEDNEETQDSMMLHAVKGNIDIIATNGKIRLQANDIEIIAVGEGGSKGNIQINATETVKIDAKKILITASSLYKLASTGKAEIVANSNMKIYSAMIQGVTDAVANRDSKVGGKDFQSRQLES